jgi:acetyl-CoA acetyltransferase
MKRRGYDGVAICAPISVAYRRYSVNSAHWWIGRALHALTQRIGLPPAALDGLSVSSFTLAPDTAVGLTQHLGLSPRWLDHVPMGGASGGVALRRAARAVQAGDADFVACVATNLNHVDSFHTGNRMRVQSVCHLRGAISHWAYNAYQDDPIQYRGGLTEDRDDSWGMAGIEPDEVDYLQIYDDYPGNCDGADRRSGLLRQGEAPAFG